MTSQRQAERLFITWITHGKRSSALLRPPASRNDCVTRRETVMAAKRLRAHFNAFLISGEVRGSPAALALWDEVRESDPLAWREMTTRMVYSNSHLPRNQRTFTCVPLSRKRWVRPTGVSPRRRNDRHA